MPVEFEALKCPICGSPCKDEDALEECVDDCLQWKRDETMQAWACCKCGALFRHIESARSHERRCKEVPNFEPEPEGRKTCLTCRHSDPEGHYFAPCPKLHFAPVQKACDAYEFAER